MTEPECRDLLGELSEYVEGAAAPAICREIERHLAGCPDCRVVVDSLRRTISLYHALPAQDVPEDVRQRLLWMLHLDAPRS